jgi:hypothetical protein
MKTVFEHIEYVKGQPHHIRKRVAYATAACGTGVIAIVWFAASLATGAFAIKGSNFADNAANDAAAPVVTTDATNQLAGAGAAAALLQTVDAPAHIEIVDTTPAPAASKQAEQTTIPF